MTITILLKDTDNCIEFKTDCFSFEGAEIQLGSMEQAYLKKMEKIRKEKQELEEEREEIFNDHIQAEILTSQKQ